LQKVSGELVRCILPIGYVGNVGYVTPLHQISVVPGHTINRIGVCSTGTTKLGERVNVQCHLDIVANTNNIVGSALLSNVLKLVDKSMSDNDILPKSFSTKANICNIEENDGDVVDMAPITLGCKDNVDSLRGLVVMVHGTRGQYIVPLSCPEKRYKVPSGLGSTLVVNNVVLMFPDVPQYLVAQDQRRPTKEQLGFLCCTSSSTSAALKGLVRYTVCDVVCRCYSCGVSDDISALCTMLDSTPCDCSDASSRTVFMVSGVKVTMCESCSLLSLWCRE